MEKQESKELLAGSVIYASGLRANLLHTSETMSCDMTVAAPMTINIANGLYATVDLDVTDGTQKITIKKVDIVKSGTMCILFDVGYESSAIVAQITEDYDPSASKDLYPAKSGVSGFTNAIEITSLGEYVEFLNKHQCE